MEAKVVLPDIEIKKTHYKTRCGQGKKCENAVSMMKSTCKEYAEHSRAKRARYSCNEQFFDRCHVRGNLELVIELL